jgi:hypothetical protein
LYLCPAYNSGGSQKKDQSSFMHKIRTTLSSMLPVLVIGLVGCDGGTDAETATATATEAEVRITVTGAFDSTLSSNGAIYCGAGEGSDPDQMFELYAMSPPQMLNLRLNRDLAVGTHPIVGSDDRARDTGADAYFYYRAPDRSRFDRVSDGSVNIKNIPAADGEALVASINAKLVDEDGASINLKAELNVAAGRQTFDECP